MQPSLRRTTPRPLRAAALAAALAAACAAPPPPPPEPVPVAVVDLAEVGRVGILDFRAEGETALEPAARAAFRAALEKLQPGAELVELGPARSVLGRADTARVDAAAIRAIGRSAGVDAVLVGELEAERIDPLEFMKRVRSTAGDVEIAGSLRAKLYETREGAEIWRTRAFARKPIAPVRIDAWGSKTVDARQIERVQSALVKDLVAQATADFEPRLPSSVAGR